MQKSPENLSPEEQPNKTPMERVKKAVHDSYKGPHRKLSETAEQYAYRSFREARERTSFGPPPAPPNPPLSEHPSEALLEANKQIADAARLETLIRFVENHPDLNDPITGRLTYEIEQALQLLERKTKPISYPHDRNKDLTEQVDKLYMKVIKLKGI